MSLDESSCSPVIYHFVREYVHDMLDAGVCKFVSYCGMKCHDIICWGVKFVLMSLDCYIVTV